MRKTLYSKRERVLREALADARRDAGLTQEELASKLKRPQSFVAKIENGDRRIDVVEFVYFSEAVGFEPSRIINLIRETER